MISRIELKKYNSAKRLLFIKAYLFSSHGMHVGEWDYVKEARRPSFKWHKELQRLQVSHLASFKVLKHF